MENPIYADIVNKIQAYASIIIHRHLRPDPMRWVRRMVSPV